MKKTRQQFDHASKLKHFFGLPGFYNNRGNTQHSGKEKAIHRNVFESELRDRLMKCDPCRWRNGCHFHHLLWVGSVDTHPGQEQVKEGNRKDQNSVKRKRGAKVRNMLVPIHYVGLNNLHIDPHSKPNRSSMVFIHHKDCLRPAGGVKHPDSDLVETGMLSAKKALGWIEGSILSNSRKF